MFLLLSVIVKLNRKAKIGFPLMVIKPLFISICCLVLFQLSFVSYANEIYIPSSITVLSVNGKVHSLNFFSTSTTLTVESGKNSIVLQYKELFEDDENDDHATIKSKPFIVIFTIENDDDLVLTHENIIDEERARLFVKQPTVDIYSSKGDKLNIYLKDYDLYQAEVMYKHTQHQSSFAKVVNNNESSMQNNHFVQKANVTNGKNAGGNDYALTMLKYWWNQASKDQKEQFQLIISQDK